VPEEEEEEEEEEESILATDSATSTIFDVRLIPLGIRMIRSVSLSMTATRSLASFWELIISWNIKTSKGWADSAAVEG
jgi:hypothetical protein